MAKVDLNIVFTGIVSYTPAAPVASRCVPEVRFIMPNSRNWRPAKNDPCVLIPPHHPFLIARAADVAKDSAGFWKGKPPTGQLFEKWVYWILNNENIRVDRLPTTGVVFGNTKDVVHLPDLCSEAAVADECVNQETARVGARVVLTSGRLSQRSVTNERYIFHTCRGEVIGPKYLADEVQVAIKGLDLIGKEIVLRRFRLNDNRSARTPIILKKTQPLMKIFFGSAPEADLGAVIGQLVNHDHGDTNLHFELHYELSRRRPYPPIPVPRRADSAVPGPIGGSDRCPPTSG